MANTKSAKKKIRVDQRRSRNRVLWENKLAKAKKSGDVSTIYKIADKMAKKKVLHKNKAGRIKAHAALKAKS